MKHLCMGEGSFEEHLAKFKLLVSQSGLDESAAVVDLFRETLPYRLQRPILLSENPPTTPQGWYDKANTFHRNWRKSQHLLSRGKASKAKKDTPKKTFTFPKCEQNPNAMDIDRLTAEERTLLMKEGKCFNAGNRATLAGIAHHKELKCQSHGLAKQPLLISDLSFLE